MLGMRPRCSWVDHELAAVMNAACTRALVPGESPSLIALLEDQGIAPDGAPLLGGLGPHVAAIEERGPPPRPSLTKVVPELRVKSSDGEGKTGAPPWRLHRVLFLLATEGRIVRARPRGAVAVEPDE